MSISKSSSTDSLNDYKVGEEGDLKALNSLHEEGVSCLPMRTLKNAVKARWNGLSDRKKTVAKVALAVVIAAAIIGTVIGVLAILNHFGLTDTAKWPHEIAEFFKNAWHATADWMNADHSGWTALIILGGSAVGLLALGLGTFGAYKLYQKRKAKAQEQVLEQKKAIQEDKKKTSSCIRKKAEEAVPVAPADKKSFLSSCNRKSKDLIVEEPKKAKTSSCKRTKKEEAPVKKRKTTKKVGTEDIAPVVSKQKVKKSKKKD